jgi:hypothetical protein
VARISAKSQEALGLYRVVREFKSTNTADEMLTFVELHRHMGHIVPNTARKLLEKGFVTGVRLDMSSSELMFCESCTYAKAVHKLIQKFEEGEHVREFGDAVHSDVWGPVPNMSLGGRHYFMTFTDDKTRLTSIHFPKSKDNTLGAYQEFEVWAEMQTKAHAKMLHSNCSGSTWVKCSCCT